MRPLTRAERSGYRATSLHADVMEFLAGLDSPFCRLSIVGRSPEGRDVPLLVMGRGGPCMLILGSTHAGEVDGKEAMLMLARELASEPPEGVRLLFYPLFNIDGNERIDPRNRALDLSARSGQVGPEEGVGTRHTPAGINLNRDYMKMEAPEMQLLHREVFLRFRPALTVDLHTTDGSMHGYHVTWGTAMNPAGPQEPQAWMRAVFMPQVTEAVLRRAGVRIFPYGNWVDEARPELGWATYSHLPRFGSNYRGLRGSPDLLLESYSYLTFEERTVAMLEVLRDVVSAFVRHAHVLEELAGRESAPGPRVPIAARLSDQGPPVEVISCPVSIVDSKPATVRRGPETRVRTKLLETFVPVREVDRPLGYVVDEAFARVLELHGISVRRISGPERMRLVSFRVRTVRSVESPDAGPPGRRETVVEVDEIREEGLIPGGAPFVPATGKLGDLAVYLLEPESDDGLVRWGIGAERPQPGSTLAITRVP